MAGKRSHSGKVEGCESISPMQSTTHEGAVLDVVYARIGGAYIVSQCPTWAAIPDCEKMLHSFLHAFILTLEEQR